MVVRLDGPVVPVGIQTIALQQDVIFPVKAGLQDHVLRDPRTLIDPHLGHVVVVANFFILRRDHFDDETGSDAFFGYFKSQAPSGLLPIPHSPDHRHVRRRLHQPWDAPAHLAVEGDQHAVIPFEMPLDELVEIGGECRVRTALGQDHVSELRIEEIRRRQRNALLFDLAVGPMDVPRPPSVAEWIDIPGSGLPLPISWNLGKRHSHERSVAESSLSGQKCRQTATARAASELRVRPLVRRRQAEELSPHGS